MHQDGRLSKTILGSSYWRRQSPIKRVVTLAYCTYTISPRTK